MKIKFIINDRRSLVIESMYDKVHQFRNNRGFQYMAEGFKYPYVKIPLVNLAAEVTSFRSIPPEFYDSDNPGRLLEGYRVFYQESKIPKADWQAVKEVSEMLNEKIRKISFLDSLEGDHREEIKKLQLEKITLRNYLKEIYSPEVNRLRVFPTETDRISRAAYMAIKRAKDKVGHEDPELEEILDEVIYCRHYLCYTPLPDVEIEVIEHTLPYRKEHSI